MKSVCVHCGGFQAFDGIMFAKRSPPQVGRRRRQSTASTAAPSRRSPRASDSDEASSIATTAPPSARERHCTPPLCCPMTSARCERRGRKDERNRQVLAGPLRASRGPYVDASPNCCRVVVICQRVIVNNRRFCRCGFHQKYQKLFFECKGVWVCLQLVLARMVPARCAR